MSLQMPQPIAPAQNQELLDVMQSTFSSKQPAPIDVPGCLVYLKVQINRLGALARYYNVFHLQYDSMPEPARTDLATIARKIMIIGQHLVDTLGEDDPLSEELADMINNVGQRIMCLGDEPVTN